MLSIFVIVKKLQIEFQVFFFVPSGFQFPVDFHPKQVSVTIGMPPKIANDTKFQTTFRIIEFNGIIYKSNGFAFSGLKETGLNAAAKAIRLNRYISIFFTYVFYNVLRHLHK